MFFSIYYIDGESEVKGNLGKQKQIASLKDMKCLIWENVTFYFFLNLILLPMVNIWLG